MEYVNKLKVLNDPVHGFIRIPNELIFDIIQHPYFQRLRRICQTGLTELVYPGAKHSRFQHALGSLHLMQHAVQSLKIKGIEISREEENAVFCAILLHDIGHGPFSHTLENSLIQDRSHEDVSVQLMQNLNKEFNGELELAIQIFKQKYPRKFLTQLVSSQLDMDRLDYLKRDSFYTGVVEGNINPDRIISTLNVVNDELVVDAKGIYSIEKYLSARMFMYWQVYNHRTSFSAELYVNETIRRAKELIKAGENLEATPALNYFLQEQNYMDLTAQLDHFTQLDDHDIWNSLKQWKFHPDKVLSYLSKSLIERHLPVSKILNEPIDTNELERLNQQTKEILQIECPHYFVHQTQIEVQAYNANEGIMMLNKDGSLNEISRSPQQILSKHLTQKIRKYHLCYLTVKKN